jgi:hypothetical protein
VSHGHLFNGKDLTGWDTPSAAKKRRSDPRPEPDPDKVFTVQQLMAGRDESANAGRIITQREFSNYHLRLQFKWGQKRWPPREREVRDSGLCYHCVGLSNATKYPGPLF